MSELRFRAVIFDLGGVVLDSPLHAIARYERETGMPEGFINRLVVRSGPTGGWARLERGELAMEAFFETFDRECAEAGQTISSRELMERIGGSSQPRPAMLEAIRRIRGRGLRTAALTNNWAGDDAEDGSRGLEPHFDVFVESSRLGLRKPDPRIYEHTCREVGVEPQQAVFLDDIGRNLKSARELGMTTIKVVEPGEALSELESLLGFALA